MAASQKRSYRSVAEAATVEIVRKRSRFIASVLPVGSEDEAQKRLDQIRAAHPGASHHCYAYRADYRSPIVRMSDDGEPQGTAGRPMLEVLERNELDNTLAVVVRYFGGTLLGAAGLVRAYSGAVAEAIVAGGVAVYTRHQLMRARFSYPDWSRVERLLETLEVAVYDVNYTDAVEADLAVEWDRVEEVKAQLTNATAGGCTLADLGSRYLPLHRTGE